MTTTNVFEFYRHSAGVQPRENIASAMENMNEDAAKLEAEMTALRKARNILRSALGLNKKKEDQAIAKGV